MNFATAAKSIFIRANTNHNFWIFDGGIAKSGSLDDLGEITYKTTSGTIEVFRVFKDKNSFKKYYIPSHIYNNGVIDEEYPIYSN